MATLMEYSHVCNVPQPLTSSKVDVLESLGPSAYIFRPSSTQDVRASLQCSEKAMYAAHKVTDFSEEKLLGLLETSSNRELFDHLHNARAKALEPMFSEFIDSVRSTIPHRYKPLLEPVKNFHELNKMVSALHEDHSFQKALESASEPFCKRYDAEPGFWEQYADLEAINTERNKVVHCSVAVSAAALSKACDGESDVLDSSLAMVEALANFCVKHAAGLDASAEEQRAKGRELTERVKQKRKSKLLRK